MKGEQTGLGRWLVCGRWLLKHACLEVAGGANAKFIN